MAKTNLLAHDLGTEASKLLALERFAVKVGPHLIGGTANDRKVAFFDLIGQKEAANVQGSRTLTCALATISLEENRTFVVLKQCILLNVEALVFYEELGPQNHCRRVISAYQLGIGAAPGVELLLAR